MVEDGLIQAAARLRDDCDEYAERIIEDGLVDYIYNPLRYAWDIHEEYLRMAACGAAAATLRASVRLAWQGGRGGSRVWGGRVRARARALGV